MRKSLALSALFLFSCGTDDSRPLASEKAPTSSKEALGFDCGAGIVKNNDTGFADPSTPPTAGQKLAAGLNITFNVKLLCPTSYSAENWFIKIGKTVDSATEIPAADLTITDSTVLGTEQRVGNLKVVTKKEYATENVEGWVDTTGGKRTMKVFLGYKNSGSNLTQADLYVELRADTGSIQAPARLAKLTSQDSAVYVEMNAPTNTEAQDSSGASTGTSRVGSYLVAYWQDSQCAASGWSFKANKIYDTAETTAECQYDTTNIDGTCSLGCGATSIANHVVPASVPAKAGFSSQATSGCYKVVKVSGTGVQTVILSGLKNDEKYGVVVWALDSSGNIGRRPSECKTIIPRSVPLSSDAKGEVDKTPSDCFVVTAASGDRYAPSVMHWRWIRDRHLYGTAFHSWYLENGPKLANFVNDNPWLKKPLNAIFEFSGAAIVKTETWLLNWKENLEKLVGSFEGLLFEKAYAQEPESSPADEENVSEEQMERVPLEEKAPIVITPTPTPTVAPTPEPTPKEPEGPSAWQRFWSEKPGSSSSQLQATVGILTLTNEEDKALMKKFYPKATLYHVMIGQTFRLVDVFGELGLGGYLSYYGADGEVPNTNEYLAEVRKKPINFRNMGIMAAVDYRLRIGRYPWIAPRFQAAYGTHYFREQATVDVLPSPEEGEEAPKVQGVSRWKRTTNLRVNLEMSMTKFLPWSDAPMARFSYGLEDFMLVAFMGIHKDEDHAVLNFTGTEWGLGLGFIFL